MENESQETEASTDITSTATSTSATETCFNVFKSDAWGKTHVTLAIAQGFQTVYEGGRRDDSGKNHCDAIYIQVKLDVAG